MKTTENNPIKKFKYLLKGSAVARNLSFVYAVISMILAYKMRNELEYVIPLIIGAILIIWYTLSHLMLKGVNLKSNTNLKDQFSIYKKRTLKREKYEFTIYFIWLLTVVPAFLNGKDVTSFTVIKWMVATYLVIAIGGRMFKKVKTDLNELEQQIQE